MARMANMVRMFGMVALPLALAGCSAAKLGPVFKKAEPTTVAAATPETITSGVGGIDGTADVGAAANGVRVGFCPKVQLITNEETYRTYSGRDRTIDNIVYQASLYDATRSCKLDGDRLVIEVTAAGRLLAGPKGAAGGTVAMPIRIAVKDGQGVPYSELETYSASIEAGRTSDQFIYSRNTVSIPATSDRRTTVLIGFDEGAPKRG